MACSLLLVLVLLCGAFYSTGVAEFLDQAHERHLQSRPLLGKLHELHHQLAVKQLELEALQESLLLQLPSHCPQKFLGNVGWFGRHNNRLIQLLNGFEIARAHGYTLVLPTLEHQGIERIEATRLYNLTLFRQAGYCFILHHQWFYGQISKIDVQGLYRTLPRGIDRPYKYLRPANHIWAEVVHTQKLLPARYVAIHMRGTDMLGNPYCLSPEGRDFCRMTPDFVWQALVEQNRTGDLPVFIATDDRANTIELYSKDPRFGPKGFVLYDGMYQPTPLEIAVDLFLLIHADFFIGNAGSSLSLNVCNMRRVMTPPRDCYRFVYCCDRPPNIAGHPCEGNGRCIGPLYALGDDYSNQLRS